MVTECVAINAYITFYKHIILSLLQLENQEILLQELLEKERLRKEYSDRTEVDKDKNSFFTLKNLKEQESVLKVRLHRIRHIILIL